jgi:sulfatase maturation enzyme AslB (radical SAM superfamily)
MIHGGLSINLSSHPEKITINHCCIRDDHIIVNDESNLWGNENLSPLRKTNLLGKWDSSCWACQKPESAGLSSFRTGMLDKFGVKENLSGPQRLDLMFDISCNLACRTCGPGLSTYWQKHLKENKIDFISSPTASRADEIIKILEKLDLSNLGMVVISGGETLLGKNYWQVVNTIADMVPNAKERLTLSFQTNGTQTIEEKYYSTIEKFHLVKLHFSIDGIDDRFEYLRWPAKWNQVVDNMLALREKLPVNVMFLIEETISIFNLYYQDELTKWVKSNYANNRIGDITNHQRHLAFGIYGLDSLSQKYIDTLSTNQVKLLNPSWSEQPAKIRTMIEEIRKFDAIRGQDWSKIFPEVAEFYSDYL